MKFPEVIYTASYGFRDNDALGKVWGRTPKYCEKLLRSTMHTEAGNFRDEERETLAEVKALMWYVGPFEEQVISVIDDLEDRSRESEFRWDLATEPHGFVY